MKETPISLCEKGFLLELRGRVEIAWTTVEITYGLDWGCCQVRLGKTRILAQVSAQVVEPMFTRPNEGTLQVNVELTSLGSPSFEGGRAGDQGVELSRLLERTLKESRCLDLESLCIVSEEKVWEIRLDIHVLNHEGNLFDASSIAGTDGKMVLGVNGYREICTLHLASQILVEKNLVLRLATTAAERAKRTVDKIKASLAQDEEARKNKGARGFAAKTRNNSILNNSTPRSMFDFTRVVPLARAVVKNSKPQKTTKQKLGIDGDVVDLVPEGMEEEDGEDKEDDEDESSDADSDCEVTSVKTKEELLREKIKEHIDLEDSEEEETTTLTSV
ncbi:uncharacterized protein LOC111704209 [Eurytemora carolleeae]|uniref:uncharacterized protein LOC111704209 n=1 Tax=Eurytemora carolleeae TaxID=1294199 RepID=UPI000C78BF04|nr:uncharacterized protein LOC111704209 [Eurytemora carolleeae]|eukprot:XP_023332130.1 uncharacterized protein LOC111704209 [Eurytemora affinis]